MELNKLPKTTRKRKKRVGRGYGSGKGGHTTGRGQKGQRIRGKIKAGFEGGQTPLAKRFPHQKGFVKPKRKVKAVLKLSSLDQFKEGTLITPRKLRQAGLLESASSAGVKILGGGKLEKKLVFKGVEFSRSALRKIKEAGGEVW